MKTKRTMKASSGIIKKGGGRKYSSNGERWQAVVRRNANANGKFYYSVKTTGVYCLPSCAARSPLRKNVAFYHSPEDAEKAGFRPCKRCRPRGPARAEEQAATIAAACRMIEKTEELPALDTLAKAVGMSRYYFHRIFKTITGLTPKAYAMAHRSERMRKELPRRKTVTEAIYGAGFNSNGRFYAKSAQMLGMKPKNFRAGGIGTTIRFAIGECSLGAILVAASEKGVCAVFMGDDPDALARNLQDRFPKANLIGGDRDFERMAAKVIGFVEAPKLGLNLPLDMRGTTFQKRVWQALCRIPIGATASYTDIATHIGSPKAVRAVAQACGANSIAVAIPCHRVLRLDGNLSGYRWGVERKRALLKREAV
jgi:AraC family transcriptional regulator of adaptative response/methylated-DNA-[protein]-cysteine methyltransferase